jgi:hypothetical protein
LALYRTLGVSASCQPPRNGINRGAAAACRGSSAAPEQPRRRDGRKSSSFIRRGDSTKSRSCRLLNNNRNHGATSPSHCEGCARLVSPVAEERVEFEVDAAFGYWAGIGHGRRLINFTYPVRGSMKSYLTRRFGTSRADDHGVHMTSLAILVIWVFE